jgi:ribosome-associated protein
MTPRSEFKPDTPEIPENELEITFARSSGPGGQNVNKRDTKAVVRWRVEESSAYTDEQKRWIAEALANRMSRQGFVVISSDAERSREMNRRRAIETLQRLVSDALTPEEERIPTKPTKASKERRLEEKARRSDIKKSRRKPDWRGE